MWKGVMPAVTTKFREDGALDHAEMARCFELQMRAGCDGLIVAGSLGEGPMLSPDERLEVLRDRPGRRRRQARAADGLRSLHPRRLRPRAPGGRRRAPRA